MPGPVVVACQGDYVIVDVHNYLPAETTTVHFHGKVITNSFITKYK